LGETITFEASFSAEIMKRVIKFKGTQEDSNETMYLNIARFKDIKVEDGKVVKVSITVETTGH